MVQNKVDAVFGRVVVKMKFDRWLAIHTKCILSRGIARYKRKNVRFIQCLNCRETYMQEIIMEI